MESSGGIANTRADLGDAVRVVMEGQASRGLLDFDLYCCDLRGGGCEISLERVKLGTVDAGYQNGRVP